MLAEQRSFQFNPSHMTSSKSSGFRAAVHAYAGITADNFDSLLSSLPSELAFNDLRDSGRRHQKSERTDAANLHSVCIKSCTKRSGGAGCLELEDRDWDSPVKGKALLARVHHALKPKDIELGVDCTGLTRTNHAYTKPHIFCRRLRLLRILQAVWEQAPDLEPEARQEHVLVSYKGLWTSKLIPAQCFIRWHSAQSEVTANMVLSSGPHAVQLVPLESVPGTESYSFGEKSVQREPVLAGPISTFEIALTKPSIHNDRTLTWLPRTPFMKIQEYVAKHSILHIPASLLSSLCTALKMKGHGKLSHKKRVEAFLREMHMDDEYIKNVLEETPDAQPRRRHVESDGEDFGKIIQNAIIILGTSAFVF